jgi:hypothetical protein
VWSGNGDSHAFNFVEFAISSFEKEKSAAIPKSLISPHAAYYFYMQCFFFLLLAAD